MRKEKPFEISNASYIPNQLFDNRCKFLTNQQKVFLIFLYRRLWGYGKTEIQLSYSVIFKDFPCIIKNKQKFSDMIKDLEAKGFIKIVRGHKKCHTYIIEEGHYKNLIYWGEKTKYKDDSDIKSDIENELTENDFTDNDITAYIDNNSLETLHKVFQYEFKKLYPNKKCSFTNDELEYLSILKNDLDEIPNIDYSTFIRCYFLNDFYSTKPSVDRLYEDGIGNYNKFKDIVKQTPINDDTMTKLYVNVYDSYILLEGMSIKNYVESKKIKVFRNDIYKPLIFYCSKYYNLFCIDNNIENNRYEKIEEIKIYPAIVQYVNETLKDDSVFSVSSNVGERKIKDFTNEEMKMYFPKLQNMELPDFIYDTDAKYIIDIYQTKQAEQEKYEKEKEEKRKKEQEEQDRLDDNLSSIISSF
jgi:hypothetical protein